MVTRCRSPYRVALAAARLGGRHADCSTRAAFLPGAAGFAGPAALEAEAAPMLGAAAGTDEARRFLGGFGTSWRDVVGAEPVADALDPFGRRVRHAVAEEMAVRLEDVVFRRTEHAQLGELDHVRLAVAVETMAAALPWSPGRAAADLADVKRRLGSLVRYAGPEGAVGKPARRRPLPERVGD